MDVTREALKKEIHGNYIISPVNKHIKIWEPTRESSKETFDPSIFPRIMLVHSKNMKTGGDWIRVESNLLRWFLCVFMSREKGVCLVVKAMLSYVFVMEIVFKWDESLKLIHFLYFLQQF